MSVSGEKIYLLRSKMGFTQQDFSNKLGYSRSYLGDIETGKVKASRRFLESIQKTFGVSFDSLVIDGLGQWVQMKSIEWSYQDPFLLFIFGFSDEEITKGEKELIDFLKDKNHRIIDVGLFRSELKLYSEITGKKCTGVNADNSFFLFSADNRGSFLIMKNCSKSKIRDIGLALRSLVKTNAGITIIVIDKPSFLEKNYDELKSYCRIKHV